MTPKIREQLEYSGGRRFLMTMGAGITSSVLVWFDKITSESWMTVVIATVAAYITGNTMQKNVAATKDKET